MRFKIKDTDAFYNDAMYDEPCGSEIVPFAGERIYLGDHYIICAPGDPALVAGDRIRLETFARFNVGFDDEDIGIWHDHLVVFDYGDFDANAFFELYVPEPTIETIAATTGLPITLELNLRDAEPVEGEAGSFRVAVDGDTYKRRVDNVTFTAERVLEAA